MKLERPYQKNGRASARVQDETQGIVSAKRIETPDSPADPAASILSKVNGAKYFICKNVGSKDIELRFNNDDVANFWTLTSGETLPVTIRISDVTDIKATSKGGKSILECLFFGYLAVERFKGQKATFWLMRGIFVRSWRLIGMTNYMMNVHTDPEFLHLLAKMMLEFSLAQLDLL